MAPGKQGAVAVDLNAMLTKGEPNTEWRITAGNPVADADTSLH